MSETTITHLTLGSLRDVLQQAGYRVETVTDPVANSVYLRSATAGLSFDIRPGNRLAGAAENFVDIAFVGVLQVQGELPLELVNRWNATRRFARLQLSQPFLVLSLDISVAGGVLPAYLRGQIEIWDHLIQQLIAYLREETPKLASAKAANSGTALNGQQPLPLGHDQAPATAPVDAA
ncbi:YbjN domain-containing protein [Bradyrhizobium sp. dw_78]|uniref:YbjN domain-containing protein n=1 Tax=Bradyrhizobium sp. dw_78 TaxID=2719793 RepID=UPI001BD33E56|nr:YbjN domain-containing protein [Bradyrhizobium sp. dw_78]